MGPRDRVWRNCSRWDSFFENGENFHSFATKRSYFIPIETTPEDSESSFRDLSRPEKEICFFVMRNKKTGKYFSSKTLSFLESLNYLNGQAPRLALPRWGSARGAEPPSRIKRGVRGAAPPAGISRGCVRGAAAPCPHEKNETSNK